MRMENHVTLKRAHDECDESGNLRELKAWILMHDEIHVSTDSTIALFAELLVCMPFFQSYNFALYACPV